LLDDPAWARARRVIDAVWFVATEERERIERLVARHIEFGKTPDEARAWVATTDQGNAELVAGTAGRADRIVINSAAGWSLA
jgi:pantothenate kinase